MPNQQTNGAGKLAGIRGQAADQAAPRGFGVLAGSPAPTHRAVAEKMAADPTPGYAASEHAAKQAADRAAADARRQDHERARLYHRIDFLRTELHDTIQRLEIMRSECRVLEARFDDAQNTHYRLERELSQARATMSALHDSIADRDRTIEALKAKRRKR